jgi:hypothetical protein
MDQQASPICRHFRTKAFYTEGRHIVDPADCAPTPSGWCVHTTMILGPDDVLCSPERCRPGRACFRAASGTPA